MSDRIVIVGTGQGGYQVAASLRELHFSGRIVLIGEEPCIPYQRPPLSKGYMLGELEEARLPLRAAKFFEDKHIELAIGRRAVAIDRAHRKVGLDDDAVLDYDHLVLAVGARHRRLPVPGADLQGVYYLRTLAEAQALRAALRAVKKAVVIGAGFIGLEIAASAAKLGVEVTVLEVADRPMARAISPEMAAIFAREHAKHGTRLLFNTQAMRLLGQDGHARGVETVTGEVIDGELIVVGIGVIANVELAATCDLEVGNGIVVNELLATADPRVSAIGDCALHPNAFAAQPLRIESVQNASDQGRCVAARLTGSPAPYNAVPWFWSDQGSLKLQIAGLAVGVEHSVVRGDAGGTACSVFSFRAGRLIAVESLNRPGEHMVARRLIGKHVAITPEQAADESFDLRHLTAS